MTQPKPSRSTPYVATGAPSSPLYLAVAGWLVALLAWLAGQMAWELPTDPSTTAAVAGIIAALVGTAQSWLARREQAAGVGLLEAALAEPPEGRPETVREAVAILQARQARRPPIRPPTEAATSPLDMRGLAQSRHPGVAITTAELFADPVRAAALAREHGCIEITDASGTRFTLHAKPQRCARGPSCEPMEARDP